MDSKIVQVALNGLENILRLGEQDSKFNNSVNPYSVMIEECYGEIGVHGTLAFFHCPCLPESDFTACGGLVVCTNENFRREVFRYCM